MIRNTLCPYCAVVMVEGENKPNGRSVEHLIPNKMLRIPRTKNDGDFYACRQCNARKSHIDYVLSTIAKTQSRNDEFAASALIETVTSDERRSERFVDMIRNGVETHGGLEFQAPVSGSELLEYIQLLGKGQYFKATGSIFQRGSQAMLIDFVNKPVLAAIEDSYELQHKSNPFRGLEQNKHSEVFSAGDCIVYSKNLQFLFVFHDYTAITIMVKRRNKKNMERERKKNEYILQSFVLGLPKRSSPVFKWTGPA